MYPLHKPLMVLALIPILFSCQPSDDSIRGTAHKFLDARLEGDFIKAASFITDSSLEQLQELAILSEEYAKPDAEKLKYRIMNFDDKGSQAQVSYLIEGYGEEKLYLAKENNKWKVVLSPLSIPDAGLLMQELRGLEQEDSADIDVETYDLMLMQEDVVDEWTEVAEVLP